MTGCITFEKAPPAPGILSALVVIYAALLPYQFEVSNAINFAVADCILVLVLLLAAGQLKYIRQNWTAWHFGIAFVFAMGSLVASLRFGKLETYELLNKDAGLFLPFLSYAAVTSAIVDWEQIRRVLRVFVWSTVLQNLVGTAAFFAAYFFGVSNPFARYGGLRLSGMLLDPNAYGGLVVMALIIVEGASWGAHPLLGAKALWFSRLTLGLGILFTFSRSAWVALLLSLGLFCMLRWRVAGRMIFAGLLAAPCLLLLMGRRFVPVFETMASRPQQVQGRFDLIQDAYAAFSQHPYFGGGLGSFRLSEGEIAHNSAMWFLADFGIVGLAIFLGFLAWFFAKGWFAYRFAPVKEKPVALALLLGHTAMCGLAMGIEAFYQRHWWLVFGLIASAYSLTLRRVRHLPQPC